jgi:hypothetical protein
MHVKALLPWALGGKVVLAIVLLVASQYHLWSRLSSGSVFSPEFPRALVFLFNWAFGAIVLLALMQIALNVTALVARLVRPGGWATPDGLCYAAAITAMLLSALGVDQATRVPPAQGCRDRHPWSTCRTTAAAWSKTCPRCRVSQSRVSTSIPA